MSFRPIRKFLIGICAVIMIGAFFGVINAKADVSWQAPAGDNCQGCHPVIQEFWANGPHGTAEVDCATCHTPVSDHPNEVMPTDVSSRLCGSCHTATMTEWADSVHGQESLTCAGCHNSHTAGLKSESVQTLCEHCHSERVHFFSFSDHAVEGLQCTDCHMQMDDSEGRVGPGIRVHTFAVDLKTCVNCHENDVHQPHEDTQICDPEKRKLAEEQGLVYPCDELEITQAGLGIPIEEDVLAVEPQSVSPFGFTIVGTLAGVAGGIIASPWLEKWFRKEQEIS